MKNGELKIEKNVPIPISTGRKGSGPIQTAMRALKKGDSVIIPGKSVGNVYSAARAYIGKGKYTVRAVDGGFRVWRIA
jgi:hypothetical protein